MAMSENSVKVLDYVKANEGVQMLYTDIADGIGIGPRQALGSINALVKKELLGREQAEIEVEKEGKVTKKVINFIHITEKGKAFDPSAEA